VAWSGKGVVSNFGGDRHEPLPALYGRRAPTEPESGGSFTAPADVVVVNLGTNDFSMGEPPAAEEFVAGYVGLLDRIRRAHGDAPILATVAPMLSDEARAIAEGYIDQAIARRREAGDLGVRRIELHVAPQGFGCDWHPSAATHEAMAARLVPHLRRALERPAAS